MEKLRGFCRGVFLAVAFTCIALSFAGCTRLYYRRQADREVYDILKEKDKIANWPIEQWHVYPDARARFADPTNPDRPEMPADDPDAWKMSPHPQRPGIAGMGKVEGTGYLELIKTWDAENRAEREDLAKQVPDGSDRQKHPIMGFFNEPLNSPQAGFLLRMDQTIELGVINSRTYQSFREDLYLAALPVTQQRFSYAYQWAATADWIRQWAGGQSNIGPQNNWTGTSTLGFSKLFATGALLTADFANSTVFNFSGAGMTSASVINVNAAQPFLQGGGKAVTLEPLAQAERNLVYSIRAYARFREQFNVQVVTGASPPGSLVQAAGTSPSGSPISTLAALGIASTDVAGGFVSYLSTLYRECDLAADKKYAHDLERALKILEGFQEGGMFSPLQVDQTRSTLLNAKNTVLSDQQFVTNGLDQFKLVLGVPANLPLILDDAPARPITEQLDRYYEVIDDADAANRFLEKQEQLEAEKLRGLLLETFTKHVLVKGTAFQKDLPPSWAVWAKTTDKNLVARLAKLKRERSALLDLKTDLELNGQVFTPESIRKLREAEFEADLGGMELLLREFERKPWEKKAVKEQANLERIKMVRQVVSAGKNVLVWARNERFEKVGEGWPIHPEFMLDDMDLISANVDAAQETAVKAALVGRLDLMNARAQVVDAWRQLKVTANSLMGVATVQYNLTAQTPPGGDRPLVFSSAATSQQLSLNFQLPLVRLAQRNAYRTAIINYQVARRSLMLLEDSIAAQVRFDVRQLQLFMANYVNQKKVLHSLYSQVENALEVIVAPSDPDQLKASGTAGQANAAALTNQYLGALGNLNNAQVKMYDIWLSLYATRMQLLLDMDRLPMDFRGVWTDVPGSSPRGGIADGVEAETRTQPLRDGERGLGDPRNAATPAANRPMFLAPRSMPEVAPVQGSAPSSRPEPAAAQRSTPRALPELFPVQGGVSDRP